MQTHDLAHTWQRGPPSALDRKVGAFKSPHEKSGHDSIDRSGDPIRISMVEAKQGQNRSREK
jgi:hypothetical protein